MKNRPAGKWVQNKILVIPGETDCYIYLRPRSSKWQYYLNHPGEGEERKSTGLEDQEAARKYALDKKLQMMARHQQGLKSRRVKTLFDFIDEFLEEESKRIKPYNQKGFITEDTFRLKSHHLKWLKKFYHDKSIKIEELDYPKLKTYPTWRGIPDPIWNPTPPKTNHTISTELTTIRAYFDYLLDKGYIPREPTWDKVARESRRVNRRDFLNPRQYMQTINTVRKWANSQSITENQRWNRQMVYQSILIMSNACLRKGELKGLKWSDLEPNPNLSKKDQTRGHLIRIRKENTKVGEPRTVQSPTFERINTIRELYGISKHRQSPFPFIPPELADNYVISKFNKPHEPLGPGTWNRCWAEIRQLCKGRYWGKKNITYYSFRHTGISFAVSRSVPLLQLSRNCGTGVRYIEDVYYHHESESKQTWDILNQNRKFHDKVNQQQDTLLVDIEDMVGEVVKEE